MGSENVLSPFFIVLVLIFSFRCAIMALGREIAHTKTGCPVFFYAVNKPKNRSIYWNAAISSI